MRTNLLHLHNKTINYGNETLLSAGSDTGTNYSKSFWTMIKLVERAAKFCVMCLDYSTTKLIRRLRRALAAYNNEEHKKIRITTKYYSNKIKTTITHE